MTERKLTEQRIALQQRREEDRHKCAVHDLLQDETKDHRVLVCKKIEQKADLTQIKSVQTQIKNILWIVGVLISVCCLVVAGGLAWLKVDLVTIKTDAISAVKESDSKIDAGFKEQKETTANIHRRISENNEIRVAADSAQTRELMEIKGELKSFNWRMTVLENGQKKK